jgi:hypothetical protein
MMKLWVSMAILMVLAPHGYASEPCSNCSAAKHRPVVLENHYTQIDKLGYINVADARRDCERLREAWQETGRYLFAYCMYHKKSWTEEVEGLRILRDVHYIGEVYERRSSAAVSRHAAGDYQRHYRRNWAREWEVEYGSSWSAEDIAMVSTEYRGHEWAYVDVPIPFLETKEFQVFGFQVFGHGLITELKFKPIYSSTEAVNAGNHQVFDTEVEAKTACGLLLLKHKANKINWSVARCQASSLETGSGNQVWRFSVLSRSPYVQNKESE